MTLMTEAAAATSSRSARWLIVATIATACALGAVLLAARADAAETPCSGDSHSSETSAGTDTDDEESCEWRHGDGARHFRGRRGLANNADAMAGLIGIETDALREALRSGQSLADVATENGVDPQTLVDAIAESITERVDARLEEGRIDAERAEKIRSGAPAIAENIVNREHSAEGKAREGRHLGIGPVRRAVAHISS